MRKPKFLYKAEGGLIIAERIKKISRKYPDSPEGFYR